MLTRLLILFNPEQFFFNLTQNQAYELLDSKPTCAFECGKVLTTRDWVKFFEKLALKEDEVARISSLNHVVLLIKKNDGYYLYDPNNRHIQVRYRNEKSMVYALKSAFYPLDFTVTTFGLGIMIFNAKNEASTRNVSDLQNMGDRHLSFQFKNKRWDSLNMSIKMDDKSCIDTNSVEINREIFLLAIQFNAKKVMAKLLERNDQSPVLSSDDQKDIFYCVFKNGAYAIFKLLLKNQCFQHTFEEMKKHSRFEMLNCSIEGSQYDLFYEIIQDTPKEIILFSNRKKVLFLQALECKNLQIMSELILFYTKNNITFSREEKNELVLKAIQLQSTDHLQKLFAFAPHPLEHLRIDLMIIYQCTPSYIELLKENGYQLTFWQEYCLQVRENHVLSFLLDIVMQVLCWLQPPALPYFEKEEERCLDLDKIDELSKMTHHLFKRQKEEEAPLLQNKLSSLSPG